MILLLLCASWSICLQCACRLASGPSQGLANGKRRVFGVVVRVQPPTSCHTPSAVVEPESLRDQPFVLNETGGWVTSTMKGTPCTPTRKPTSKRFSAAKQVPEGQLQASRTKHPIPLNNCFDLRKTGKWWFTASLALCLPQLPLNKRQKQLWT